MTSIPSQACVSFACLNLNRFIYLFKKNKWRQISKKLYVVCMTYQACSCRPSTFATKKKLHANQCAHSKHSVLMGIGKIFSHSNCQKFVCNCYFVFSFLTTYEAMSRTANFSCGSIWKREHLKQDQDNGKNEDTSFLAATSNQYMLHSPKNKTLCQFKICQAGSKKERYFSECLSPLCYVPPND